MRVEDELKTFSRLYRNFRMRLKNKLKEETNTRKYSTRQRRKSRFWMQRTMKWVAKAKRLSMRTISY